MLNLRAYKRLPLILAFVWLGLLLSLGVWWLYLLIKLSNQLVLLNSPTPLNYLKIVKYEGLSFFILLILTSATLIYFYYQEMKQANSLKAFFASLTHELKTPLASMKLQTEVIKDLIERGNIQGLPAFADKLINDSKRLELELDKILHLSRIERGVNLPIQEIDLKRFIKSFLQKNKTDVQIEFKVDETKNHVILADEFALTLIMRNLLDNSQKHSTQKKVIITLDGANLDYQDETQFSGDLGKLGTIFYKHNSPKGSGIGIYLIKKLTESMQGHFKLIHSPTTLLFSFQFKEENK